MIVEFGLRLSDAVNPTELLQVLRDQLRVEENQYREELARDAFALERLSEELGALSSTGEPLQVLNLLGMNARDRLLRENQAHLGAALSLEELVESVSNRLREAQWGGV